MTGRLESREDPDRHRPGSALDQGPHRLGGPPRLRAQHQPICVVTDPRGARSFRATDRRFGTKLSMMPSEPGETRRGAPGGSYEEFVLDAIEPRGRLDEFAAVEMLPIVDENANAAPREGQIGAICANQQSLAALGGGRRACQLSLGFTKFTAWLNRPVPWLTARTSTRMSASTLGRVGVRP